jgi:flagellar protein FliO/FliZ
MPTNYATPTDNLVNVSFWFVAIILLIILLLVFYYILVKTLRKGPKSKEVKMVKKYYLDRNLYVGVLKVFNEYYVILATSNSSEIVRKLEEEEVQEIMNEHPKFLETFSNILKKDKISRGREEEKLKK